MARQPVEFYINQHYPFDVVADEDVFVVVFSDLPGCMTQVDAIEEIGAAAEEARTLWIETAYEQGLDIPMPSQAETFSGRFNVRIPRSLHQQIARNAQREGCSLNQYVTYLLSAGNAHHEAASNLRQLREAIAHLHPTGRS